MSMGSESFGFNLVFSCRFGNWIAQRRGAPDPPGVADLLPAKKCLRAGARRSDATTIRLPPRFDAPEFVLQRLFVAARLLAIARTAHEIPDFRQE